MNLIDWKIICPWTVFIILSIAIGLGFYKIDPGVEITNLEQSQTKRLASKLFIDKLESIGKISLAIIGALWAFIIYEGTKIKLLNAVSINIFILTNICLLFSFIFYFTGYDFLVNYIFYHSTIDLEAPIVQFWRWAQLLYFFLGLVFFVFTILVTLKLDKNNISLEEWPL
jgi:hypothetical protein